MKTITNNLRVLMALLHRDMRVMGYTFVDNIIDSAIILGMIYLIYGHLLPLMGLSSSIVTPVFFGMLFIVLINVAYDRAMRDVLDFDTTKFVEYQVILPISNSWLIVKYILSYTIDLFFSSFPILCLGKIIFGPLLETTHMNWPLFFLVYFLGMIFIGILLLTAAAGSSTIRWFTENVWPFFLSPMIMLGSVYYPWRTVVRAWPTLSTGMLFIPTTYIVEGLRSAATAQPLYISAVKCALILLLFITGMMFILFHVMKKRLNAL